MAAAKRPCKGCGSTTYRAAKPGPRCTPCWWSFRKAQKARTHDNYVQATYGKGPGWYEAQMAAQGGCCGACGKPMSLLYKRPAVDHDHKCCPGPTSCGKCVRGLLHKRCNTILGWYRDDPEVFDTMARYLRNGGFDDGTTEVREDL